VREQLNRGVVPDGVDVHCLAGLIKVLLFFPNYLEIYLELQSRIVGFCSGRLFESCVGGFNNMLMLIIFLFLTTG